MNSKERRAQEKAQLRRSILSSASEILNQQGREGLSIRKIAERIGYSPRTIYLHFSDKEELLGELIEEGFAATLARRREHEPVPEEDSLARFRSRCRAHIHNAIDHPHFYRAVVSSILFHNAQPGPRQQEVLREAREDLAALLTDSSENEVEEKLFILIASLRGFSLSLVGRKEQLKRVELEQLIERYLDLTTKMVMEEME